MLKITQLTGKIVFMMLSKLLVASKKCLQAARHRISIISYSAQIYLITVDFGKSSVAYGRRAKSYNRHTIFIYPHTYKAFCQQCSDSSPQAMPGKQYTCICISQNLIKQNLINTVIISIDHCF